MATPSRTSETRSSVPGLSNQGPDSHQGPITRKRAASMKPAEATHTLMGKLTLDPHGSSGQPPANDMPDSICLCTAPPKIPRPRNAFILYRQHNQARVVAQHQGIANPEISKIIGEQWREEREETKQQWRRLAEEEKQRHQQQYPDYRYQPRRGGRGAAARSDSITGEDPGSCPKCGGRYITTPHTPSTPVPAMPAPNTSMSSDLKPGSGLPEAELPRRSSQSSSYPGLEVGRKRSLYAGGGYHRLQSIGEDYENTSAPDVSKRRRFNNPGSCHGIPPPDPYAGANLRHRLRQPSLGTAAPVYSYHSDPAVLAHYDSPAGYIGPPPPASSPSSPSSAARQPMPAYHHPHHPPVAAFHDSLRLPPLQTQPAASDPPAADGGLAAVVMGIPFVNKLRVLERISPPLATARGARPGAAHGAVVAVDGADPALVARVGAVVERALRAAAGECALRVWAGDEGPWADGGGGGAEARAGPADLFGRCFRTVMGWHARSREMVEHITTATPPGEDRVPVALVTGGFSLTASDRFACQVPIADAYAPVDHWQWMATLWRGVVGPDLVVYVQGGSEEEVARAQAVELREPRLMVVRVREGAGGVDETTERRLGFEVVEWVRAGTFRTGF